MNIQKDNPHRIKMIRYSLMSVIILVACAMVVTTQKIVNQGMKNHQLQMVDMVTLRIAGNMNNYFQGQWDNIQYVQNLLKYRSFTSEAEVLSYLDEQEESMKFSYDAFLLLLIDNNGFYYSSEAGKIALWRSPNTAFASTELDRDKSVSINSLAEVSSQSKEYLCFTKKLETPIVASDGSCFTHMVLATDDSIFDIELSLSSFGKITDAFVINSEGKTINAQEINTDLAKTYNLVKTLENANFFMGNTYEDLLTSLPKHKNIASMIEYSNQSYYITFQYMGIEDWYTVFLVDQQDIQSNIRQIMYNMSIWLAVGFVLIGIALSTLLLYNTRIYLHKERKNKEQLRIAMEKAKQADQAKSEFLSRMSHDIRTPLGGIIGMTDMAKASVDDKTVLLECLRKISSASKHLQTLVNEVLDIARIESGKISVNNEPINIFEMLSVVNDIIESRTINRKQTYETDFSGVIHSSIISDVNLLKQILLNLLGNSVKYTKEGGCIKFKVFEEVVDDKTAKYHFIIEDNGIGMKPEFLEHVYERFTQEAVNARSSYEGTGLGMAIVKEFVDLLKGTINIESEVDVGTKFEVVFNFPISCDIHTKESDDKEYYVKKAWHILLAEDNEINREIAMFMLSNNGMTCVAVDDGQQLVDMFEASDMNEFDAIMTDIRMPVLNGLDAIKTIRNMDREDAKTIPCIAITANAYSDDKDIALAAGINAHLAKPLDAEQVIKTLNILCGK